MERQLFGMAAVATVLAGLVAGAVAQEPSATVRTHQGLSFKLTDPSLEVFYTIGEPKEKKEEMLPPIVSVTTALGGIGAAGEQAAGAPAPPPGLGAEKEEKLLRGHAQATGIMVSKEGVEYRIQWDRIRAMFFTRKPVNVVGLPSYVPLYRYGVSVTLVDGERVDADYVNLGGAILRGITPDGRVDIPWEEVQQVIFER